MADLGNSWSLTADCAHGESKTAFDVDAPLRHYSDAVEFHVGRSGFVDSSDAHADQRLAIRGELGIMRAR